MLSITLVSLAAAAAITGSIVAYQRVARTVIMALEVIIYRKGEVSTSEIFKFKNEEALSNFVANEIANAQNLPMQPENVNGIRNIYLFVGDEEILTEIKRNSKTLEDAQKYINRPPENVRFRRIK
jgi:hypothetical protein